MIGVNRGGGDLLELAERCEAATGADREIDRELSRLLFGRQARGGALAYTASVDAALTLVPERWRFIVDSDGCHCRMTRSSREGRDVTGFATSIALAICAAALRARSSHD